MVVVVNTTMAGVTPTTPILQATTQPTHTKEGEVIGTTSKTGLTVSTMMTTTGVIGTTSKAGLTVSTTMTTTHVNPPKTTVNLVNLANQVPRIGSKTPTTTTTTHVNPPKTVTTNAVAVVVEVEKTKKNPNQNLLALSYAKMLKRRLIDVV
jgi:hypothetical protein